MTPFLKKPSANGAAATEGEATDAAGAHARELLGNLLLEAGLLDDAQLEQALREGGETGERLGEVVVRHGWVSEDDVARLLAEQAGLEYLDRASIWFDASALTRLSREDAQRLEALPVRIEGDQVMVAVAEPTEERLAELRHVIGEDTVVVVVPKTALDGGIDLLATRGETPEATPSPPPRPKEPPKAAEEEPPKAAEEVPPKAAEEVPPKVAEAAPAGPAAAAANGAFAPEIDLAAQARSFADSIAAQAAAMQESQKRIVMLESEMATLEGQLDARRAALQEAKAQIAAVLQLLETA